MEIHFPNKQQAGALWEEVETLKRNVGEVLKHPDEFVLVKKDEIIGFFPTFSGALEEGYRRFGLDGFMAQNIRRLITPMRIRPGLIPVTLD